ncbi:MAG: CRISPR-associated endonuclease Cas2 [candidate division WOR-3 bacterium]
MRIILYDYETEKIRKQVRKNLKKIGIHAQWSVFETLENYKKIESTLLEEEQNYRIAVFRINPKGEIKKIGKEWEKIKFVF